MIFADNCYLLAESKEQILKMIGGASEELKKRGLDWKEKELELISWSFCEEMGDIHLENEGKQYVIKEVTTLQAMGTLVTMEADSMSAMKFRMPMADIAFRMNMKFYKKKRNF